MKNNKIIISAFLSLAIILILASNILAFGVSSKYYNGYPMYLLPGQTQSIKLILQNPGPDNVTITASIKTGGDIIRITDSSNKYLAKVGELTTVNLEAAMPSNAKLYQDYPIDISFTEAGGNAGGLGLLSAIDQHFDIIAAESPAPAKATNQTIIFGLIIAIALTLIAIVFFVVKKNKRK